MAWLDGAATLHRVRLQHTTPIRTGGTATAVAAPPAQSARDRQAALLQAAFRDLHGPRLHGFAQLVTLGDRSLAAAAASRALAEGASRVTELRHPERAAAWLRRRVLQLLPRDAGSAGLPQTQEAVLAALGLGPEVVAGLRGLSLLERVALVVADLERLDPRDVAAITRREDDRLQQLLVRARRRYLAAATRVPSPPGDRDTGPLRQRIAAHATDAMGGGGA